MNSYSARQRVLRGLLVALALASAAAIAGTQEDAKAPQQRPVTNTAQQPPEAGTPATSATSSTTTLAKSKFDLLDANRDGYIDKTEAAVSSVLTTQFDKLDGNHDGKLSLTEFAAINDLAAIKVDRKGYQ
jgi:hypothetical protein